MRISDWSSNVCSSDLLHRTGPRARVCNGRAARGGDQHRRRRIRRELSGRQPDAGLRSRAEYAGRSRRPVRSRIKSEEHTSVLQSLMGTSYAVFHLKEKNCITNLLKPYTNTKLSRETPHY